MLIGSWLCWRIEYPRQCESVQGHPHLNRIFPRCDFFRSIPRLSKAESSEIGTQCAWYEVLGIVSTGRSFLETSTNPLVLKPAASARSTILVGPATRGKKKRADESFWISDTTGDNRYQRHAVGSTSFSLNRKNRNSGAGVPVGGGLASHDCCSELLRCQSVIRNQ